MKLTERIVAERITGLSQLTAAEQEIVRADPALERLIEENRPELLERMQRLASDGRIEMLGGGMYEPILTMLTADDLRGRIGMMADHVEKRFGQRPKGIWLPERVWMF